MDHPHRPEKTAPDPWRNDPAVKRMRKLFRNLEKWEQVRLRKLQREHVSPWDPRLREVYERTLDLHSRAMAYLERKSGRKDWDLYETLFKALFDHVLAEKGFYCGVPILRSPCAHMTDLLHHLFPGSFRRGSF